MSTSYVSPNMSLIIPVPTQNPGPDYAYNVNASLTTIDSHNHSAGSGVQITPSGLNINATLNINNQILQSIQAVNFQAQSGNAANYSLFFKGVDLYITDGSANVIRVTQSGSVAGSSGTITGLPSGTASASYSASTFTFQSATSTAANIDGGSYIFRNLSPNSTYGLTLSPPNALAANYTVYLPTLPGSGTQVMTLSSAGNMSSIATTGTGSAVLASTPTIASPNLTSPSISGTTVVNNTIYFTRSGGNLAAIGASGTTLSLFNGPGAETAVTIDNSQNITFTGTPNVTPPTATAHAYGKYNNTGGTLYVGLDDSTGLSFANGAYSSAIFSSANTNLGIYNNNNLRINIIPSGDVNIYQSGAKSGAAVGCLILGDPGNVANGTGIYMRTSGEASFSTGGSTGFFTWYNNGGEKMRLTAAGRLGLGNTSPSSLLGVGSASQLTVDSSGNLATSGSVTFISTDSTSANAVGTTMTSTGANAIGATMTSTGANAVAATRTRATGTSVGTGGVAISGSSGAFIRTSGLYAVTGLSVTITTSGRPVFVGLMADGSNAAYLLGAELILRRDSGVANYDSTITAQVPPSSVFAIDTPSAGSHTYDVLVNNGSGTSSVYYTKLVAYEL